LNFRIVRSRRRQLRSTSFGPASSIVTLVLSADFRPQTPRQRLRKPERCSVRSMSLDGRPSSIRNRKPGDQNPGTRKPGIGNPGIRNPGRQELGSRTCGTKNRGLPAAGIASKPPTSPRTQRPPGVPVACRRTIPNRMLAEFRPARYDDRSRAGRRSPTGGGPQPAWTDEQSDAPEAATTSSKMEQSLARPR
jgi:hypothetical protein